MTRSVDRVGDDIATVADPGVRPSPGAVLLGVFTGALQPPAIARVVRAVWVLVLLGAVITVLAVVLDDQIIRSTRTGGTSADDTRVPPTFTPVVVVLDVVLSTLVLVLLAFVRGGHHWARNSLAVTLVLIEVATVAVLVTVPPSAFVAPIVLLLVLVALLLHLLFRPAVTAHVRL